jgi:hypothetical protein
MLESAAFGLLKKVWPFLVIAVLGGLLVFTRNQLMDLRQADRAFRDQIGVELHSKKTDRVTLLAELHAAIETSNNRKATLDQISQKAQADAARSKQDDAALKQQLESYRKQYAQAQHRIRDLELRKTAGNLLDDWKILTEDTKAAWENWK